MVIPMADTASTPAPQVVLGTSARRPFVGRAARVVKEPGFWVPFLDWWLPHFLDSGFTAMIPNHSQDQNFTTRLVGGLEDDFYFPLYWECHHPNGRTLIFFRGVFPQPPTCALLERSGEVHHVHSMTDWFSLRH